MSGFRSARRRGPPTAILVLVALATLAAAAGPGAAQSALIEQGVDTGTEDIESGAGIAAGSFLVVPIPFRDPTIGAGLALGAGYLFNADPASDPSLFGIGGFYSENGSLGFGALARYNFGDGRWKLGAAVGRAELNYDLLLFDTPLPLNQKADFLSLDLGYGATSDLSVGVGLRYLDTEIVPDSPDVGELPPSLRPDADLKLLKLGGIVEWDRRDDTIYPTRGTDVRLDAFQGFTTGGATGLGSLLGDFDATYTKVVLGASGFVPLPRNGVLGGRAVACGASEDAPFFDSCVLGAVDGFRGYPVTQFIDERLLSAQAEYRVRLTRRLGLTAFAGAGVVGPTFGDALASEVRAAAGIGARLRLTERYPVDFSLDATINRDGDSLFYIFVGQAF